MPKIFDNFSLSSVKFLDNRQKWKSLGELKANAERILMPDGYEVCINGRWYQLSTEDERDTSKYVCTERTIRDVSWLLVLSKPFETINTTYLEVLEDKSLTLNTSKLMLISKYVDSVTGNIKKANEAIKITGVDTSNNLTYYGKDNEGNIGFHSVQESMTSDMNSSDIRTFISELNGLDSSRP